MITFAKNVKSAALFCGFGEFKVLLNDEPVRNNCKEYQRLKREMTEKKNEGKAEEANLFAM